MDAEEEVARAAGAGAGAAGAAGAEENNNNVNDENGGDSVPRPPARPLLQIEDEEEWLRRNGLLGEPFHYYGDESEYNQSEAKKRVQEQARYQNEIHNKLFETITQQNDNREQIRNKRLDEWKDETIDIYLHPTIQDDDANDDIMKVNLKMLASYSDTVFTMADSRQHFEATTTTTSSSNRLSLSLTEFHRDAMDAFLKMLPESHVSSEKSSTIHEEHIVDACRLAHYLQCTTLLDKLVQILMDAIDAENCMSLCQLADQLCLTGLREASLNYIVQSFSILEEEKNNESLSLWNDLGSDLKEQIKGIQTILKSNNRSTLYFSSFDEYVAMLAEQVQYYKERLAEAKMQQSERQQQHNDDNSSQGWAYAQAKIEQQTERVHTLQLMLEEQKRIFLKKDYDGDSPKIKL